MGLAAGQRPEGLLGHFNGAVEILALLIFDVPLDHLVGDGTGGRGKVAPCPEMPSPEFLAQLRKHLEELIGTLALELLHGIGNVQRHGIRDEQMDMIWGYFAADDVHLQFRGNPADELPHGLSCLSYEHPPTVLREPDKMHFHVRLRVPDLTIQLDHAVILRPPTFDLKDRLKAWVSYLPPLGQ